MNPDHSILLLWCHMQVGGNLNITRPETTVYAVTGRRAMIAEWETYLEVHPNHLICLFSRVSLLATEADCFVASSSLGLALKRQRKDLGLLRMSAAWSTACMTSFYSQHCIGSSYVWVGRDSCSCLWAMHCTWQWADRSIQWYTLVLGVDPLDLHPRPSCKWEILFLRRNIYL